ncbi:uncharacterized protein LOC131281910 [Anopheles ziemanni]|uniref:uncharacterized protein LOC131265456 n=1 Tax=Anopheles coustani TaxID=139045 RepID=UPI0026592B43|nr:uncharacterized protein LOC131265456 [Anopheles coustani]XP_058167256.1 uncharacterized protein LOC131281910 [Anopheles ziemanni]
MLFEAVQSGDLDRVRQLLDGGADVNARDDKFFNTALHRAVFARQHRLPLIELLVARGADCDALNKKRQTAAELALANGLEEVAKQLVRCETEPLDDHRAYYRLIRRGNLQLFEYLISLKRLRYEDEILIIARAYGELRLKNVPLDEPMESYLTEILINHDYWLRNDGATRADVRRENVRRLRAIVENVQELCRAYTGHNLMDVDSLFLLRLSYILENLFFVRNHYKQLPLHHMEFCIGIFLHIWKNPPRYDIYKMLVDKRKLLLYLSAVAGELKKILALPGNAVPDGAMRTSSLSSSSEERSGSTGSCSSTTTSATSVPKQRPGKFRWTTERNRELMFCHYVVVAGGESDGSSDGQRYRTRLHELWTERQRTLACSSSSGDDSAFDEPACELSEQNLLTQQRKIVREQLLPEDVQRKVEMEAVGYRYYLHSARPKLSDKHRKVFRKLAKSYRRMKELHAINRALSYIDSVFDLDWASDREIKTLAMKRVVQVICETLRGGRDTPTITRHAESFINIVTPQRILASAKIRDYLSHYRRGGDLLSLLPTGCTSEHSPEQLHISDDTLDYEEVHRNLKILRSLFLFAQNLQYILAIKTLINRLYDSKSLQEIKSYYAYLFRHNSSDYLQDLEFAPFTLLEIGTLLDAIADEYRRHELPPNERLERMRTRLANEIDSYKVLHRQFSNTILMVDCLISKIKSNHNHDKIRHTFRSHLQVFQRNQSIDRQVLVQLRNALLGYFYEDLPELRRRSTLEQRLALLVVRVLYTIDAQLYRKLADPREPPVLQLTSSGSVLLKRLEETTGVRLPVPINDPIFSKMRDNPSKRYDLLRQLLRRHRVAYGGNLLADLRREEERATEEKVAQLQKLFLDQNMNMKTFDRTDEIAFEMLMLEATNALSGKLANNRDSLCNYVPVLTGRNLRNYLAHGHITYEILIPNVSPKTIILNALSVIKLSKNIISEIYERHRWSFEDKVTLLKHQETILGGFRYQSCSEARATIRAEAYLLGQSHLGYGIIDHLIQQQSCMLLGHLLDFDRVDEFLKPLAYLMEPVTAIPGGRPLHSVLGDVRARREFCYNLAVLSNDEDILSKIVADFGYGQIDAIPMVYNFDRLFASFLETHPDYDVNADSNTEILHYAVQSGNVELLNLLLDQCHDLNLRDAFGQTPLDVACKLSNVEMVKALTNAGAKWYTNGEHGCSQYSWIFLNNDQDTIVFLKNNDLLSAKVASACIDLFLQYCDDTNEEIVEFMLANNGVEYGDLYTKAATFRRLHVLQFLFESDRKAKFNVNRKDSTGQGMTPLHAASSRGYVDVVELLLRHGANVQAKDTNGNSALHFAVECGNVRIVRALLRHGASIGVRNSLGKSPLELSLDGAPARLTRTLLGSGQPVENVILPEYLDNCTLVERLQKLTGKFEYCLSPADSFGDSFTPLHQASNERVFEKFLKLYDIDVPSPRYATTPLHLACLCNELRRVKLLLKHGANPTLENSEGVTPLQLAVGNRNTPLVRTLLEHNSRNGKLTEDLDVVLAIAVKKCALDIANLLLQKGASIETIGKTLIALSPPPRGGKTSLQQQQQQQLPSQHQLLFGAAREGYSRILEYLLESGLFDVNSKDTIGSTPLFHALAGAPLETLDILLQHGADVEHRNRFGHNVLSIATMAGRLDVIRYCVNNCPEVVRFVVDAECDTDNTVLHMAVLRGALDIVRYCVDLHLANGYGLNAQNQEGFTALHISAQTGAEAIFRHLLGAGADPSITSANGQSILHTAICNQNLAIVCAILGTPVQPIERELLLDLEQRSPLHYAVFSRNVTVVREILKLPQLPLNHCDARGNTALHLAAEFQAIDIYNLLQKRVDNELRNANGKRAIDILLRK